MTETGFLKGFQNPEIRFLKGFKRCSNEFPNSLKLLETRFLKGFQRVFQKR